MIVKGGIQDREGEVLAGNGTAGKEHASLTNGQDPDARETQEWLESLEAVLYVSGKDRAQYLLGKLGRKAERSGVPVPWGANTPSSTPSRPTMSPPFPGIEFLNERSRV